jgi:hypothetical protein
MLQGRDPMLTRARFGATIVPALIMGLVFLNLDDTQEGVQGKVGACHARCPFVSHELARMHAADCCGGGLCVPLFS